MRTFWQNDHAVDKMKDALKQTKEQVLPYDEPGFYEYPDLFAQLEDYADNLEDEMNSKLDSVSVTLNWLEFGECSWHNC